MKFENIIIEGFRSIDRFSLNLSQKGITLIKGANGQGKSTIPNAIFWALYGKTLDGASQVTTWNRLRPKEYQGAKVELYWQNKGHLWKVVRCQDYKGKIEGAIGSDRLLLYKDSEPIAEKRKNEIQSAIVDALGLSQALLINSIVFGQGLNRLIQESNSEQKTIFEEVFNLQYITDASVRAKNLYQSLEREVYTQEKILVEKNNSLEALQNNLKNSQKEAENYNHVLNQKIQATTERLKLVAKEVETYSQWLKYNPVPYEKAKAQALKAHEFLKETKAEWEGVTLVQALNKLVKLMEQRKYKTALNYIKKLIRLSKAVEICEMDLETKRAEFETLKTEYLQAMEGIEKFKSKSELLETLKGFLADLKQSTKPKEDKSLPKQIKALEEQVAALSSKVGTLKKESDLYQWAYKNPLGPNGIKAYLFENSMGELNELLAEFSEILGISIAFEMFTDKARKEFKAIISVNGCPAEYKDLSGGQKQLVNLAMALAMNLVVANKHNINLAFMDEVFESLSADNIDIVVQLLRSVYKEKNLFLITHHESLPLGNLRTLHVSQVNGLSHYSW